MSSRSSRSLPRTCIYCGRPLDKDDARELIQRAHLECALEQSRSRVKQRIAEDHAREERARAIEKRICIEVARKHERAAVLAWLRARAAQARVEAGRWRLDVPTNVHEICLMAEARVLSQVADELERCEHIEKESVG